jgi:PAS domain S-box-containing protein
MRQKDGTYITLEDKGQFYPDSNGNLNRMVGFVANITERKRTEEALRERESEERWQLALRGNNDSIWDLNLKTNQCFHSPRWREMLGYEEHEASNDWDDWETRIHPDDLGRVMKIRQEHLQRKTPHYIAEYRIRCKDGSYKWILSRAQAMWDEAGNPVRIVGSHTDITERKRTEEALRESEERWQLALRGNNDGIWDLDIKNNRVFYSARWKEMLGYEDDEIPNASDQWTKRVHPDDIGWVTQLCQDHVQGKTPYFIAEYRMRCKDGSYKWILDRGHALRDEAGNLVRIIGSHTDITERKQAEEALRESETQYRTLVANIPGVVYRCAHTQEWQGMFISDGIEDLCGYPASDFAPGGTRNFASIIYPEDVEKVDQVVEAAITERQPFTLDYRIVHTDGSLRWVYDKGEGIFGEQGELLWLDGVIFDISDRKQAEETLQQVLLELEKRVEERTAELTKANDQLRSQIAERRRTEAALRQSEKQFRQVFEESPIGMALCSPERGFISVNRAYIEMLGYTESELSSLSFRDITHPEDLELEIPYLERAIKGETDGYQLEKRYLKKNQEILWVNLTCVLLRDEAGEMLYCLGMVEDITERKQAEEALQQSEARYRAIVEDQTELICRFKPDGTLTFVNDAYCRYFSKECFELIGHSFLLVIPEEDREFLTQSFSLSDEQPIITYEHRVILPSGEIRWQQWTDRAVMFDEQGKVIEFQGVGRDITELKQAEAEIRKALEKERELSELRSGFVSLVSHEFRTPLTTIQSSAELLERYGNRFSDEKKQIHLTRILSAVKRMTQLLEDILTIGKAEAGKLQFEPSPMDLVAFCREIVESMQISARPHYTINFVTQGDGSDAQMDEKLLGHILTNLLSNGIKYSPRGDTVQFDLICRDSWAIFRIQDSGIGIPQEDLEKLFESFQRASNVGTIPGTGLGLAIVQKCVNLHGGKITVESEVGEGTTFTVTLPLR